MCKRGGLSFPGGFAKRVPRTVKGISLRCGFWRAGQLHCPPRGLAARPVPARDGVFFAAVHCRSRCGPSCPAAARFSRPQTEDIFSRFPAHPSKWQALAAGQKSPAAGGFFCGRSAVVGRLCAQKAAFFGCAGLFGAAERRPRRAHAIPSAALRPQTVFRLHLASGLRHPAFRPPPVRLPSVRRPFPRRPPTGCAQCVFVEKER